MKCNKNIAFLVLVICKLHFEKENQLWSKFGWVVELRTFAERPHFFNMLRFCFLFATICRPQMGSPSGSCISDPLFRALIRTSEFLIRTFASRGILPKRKDYLGTVHWCACTVYGKFG